MTDPAASSSTMATVGILKECNDKICRVNMKTQAAFIDG